MLPNSIFKLIIAVLLSSAVSSAAFSSIVNVTSEDEISISKMKFHPGDNIEWAEPKLNDSFWKERSTQLDLSTMTEREFPGIGWFRTTLNVEEALFGEQIALTIEQQGASEIYLNGKLIHHYGSIKDVQSKNYNPANTPLTLTLDFEPHQTLAIRYANANAWSYYKKYGRKEAGLSVAISNPHIALHQKIGSIAFHGYASLPLVGFFLALTFIHFILFAFNRKEKSNLFYACFTALFSIMVLTISPLLSEVVPYNDLVVKLRFLGFSMIPALLLSLLCMVNSLFAMRQVKKLQLVAAIVGVAFVLNLAGMSLGLYITYGLIFLLPVELIRSIVAAIVKKKPGARLIGSGILSSGILLTIALLLLPAVGGTALVFDSWAGRFTVMIFILSVLSIPLTMSVTLSRQFAFHIQAMKQQLRKIAELNHMSINHEREKIALAEEQKVILESQVREKTREILASKQALETQNEALQTAKINAENSQKAKEAFLANMSHEIRTPMNAIKGMTNLILQKDPSEQHRIYLDAIKKSSDNLLIIINDILDFSKIEAGKIEFEDSTFNVREVIDTVYHTLHFKAEEKSIYLKALTDDAIPQWIVGDPVRLGQILLNLSGNAVKFTENGGVTIQTDLRDYDKKTQTARLNFAIKDTGVGIPADKLCTIFEGFSQAGSDTTRKFGGTGLGLTISKQLTELQDGKIWVESTMGEGSIFNVEITFPVSTEDPDAAKTEIKVKPNDIGQIKILLAEDNEFNQIVAVDTIDEWSKDIIVDVAQNGKEAIEKIEQNDYAIVLMDIHMPEMNGLEATTHIRSKLSAHKRNIPIMAMTASALKEEREQCSVVGMNDYIAKPFNPDELFQKISNIVRLKK